MVEAYILIKVKVGAERNVVEKLKKLKEIRDINELYGEWDIIAKIEVPNIEDLDALITEKIRDNDEIELTSTMIVAKYVR
jgi:DNA-binding Lrp family transcriptional regulator